MEAVRSGKIKASSTDKEGQTPLHVAVEAGFSCQVVIDLINLGCEVDAQTVDGTTALHAAMFNENEQLFIQLLSLGASADLKDESGDTVRQQCTRRFAKFGKHLSN